MNRQTFLGAMGVLVALGVSTVSVANGLGESLSTQRRVHGIITSVDESNVTITPLRGKTTVTGRVDIGKTRVVIDGRTAKPSDLKVTYTAKAELNLDDIWVTIIVDSNR